MNDIAPLGNVEDFECLLPFKITVSGKHGFLHYISYDNVIIIKKFISCGMGGFGITLLYLVEIILGLSKDSLVADSQLVLGPLQNVPCGTNHSVFSKD